MHLFCYALGFCHTASSITKLLCERVGADFPHTPAATCWVMREGRLNIYKYRFVKLLFSIVLM